MVTSMKRRITASGSSLAAGVLLFLMAKNGRMKTPSTLSSLIPAFTTAARTMEPEQARLPGLKTQR